MAVILILDDKGTNRNIYSRLAQTIEDGAVVHAFASPVEALEWLQGNAADLIVTDFRMPGMDGAEFTKHARSSANGIDVMQATSARAEKKTSPETLGRLGSASV